MLADLWLQNLCISQRIDGNVAKTTNYNYINYSKSTKTTY